MNLVQIGTNEFFPNSPLLNSRKPSTTTQEIERILLLLCPRVDSGVTFGVVCHRVSSFQVDGNYPVQAPALQSSEQSALTQRSFPTGIHDGGRRELREPRPCSLAARNVSRDLAAVGIPPQVQESPVRGSNEGALGCNVMSNPL